MASGDDSWANYDGTLWPTTTIVTGTTLPLNNWLLQPTVSITTSAVVGTTGSSYGSIFDIWPYREILGARWSIFVLQWPAIAFYALIGRE